MYARSFYPSLAVISFNGGNNSGFIKLFAKAIAKQKITLFAFTIEQVIS
jgi:hypothetical protein